MDTGAAQLRNCVICRSTQTLRAKCRWVPLESMIADTLTKRHGTSVTLLKFVKTGELSTVDEAKVLLERRRSREVHGRKPATTSTAGGQERRTYVVRTPIPRLADGLCSRSGLPIDCVKCSHAVR